MSLFWLLYLVERLDCILAYTAQTRRSLGSSHAPLHNECEIKERLRSAFFGFSSKRETGHSLLRPGRRQGLNMILPYFYLSMFKLLRISFAAVSFMHRLATSRLLSGGQVERRESSTASAPIPSLRSLRSPQSAASNLTFSFLSVRDSSSSTKTVTLVKHCSPGIQIRTSVNLPEKRMIHSFRRKKTDIC